MTTLFTLGPKYRAPTAPNIALTMTLKTNPFVAAGRKRSGLAMDAWIPGIEKCVKNRNATDPNA